jgi:TolA-binding protein
MHQDINTIIADFVNAAVERKLNEWSDERAHYMQRIIDSQQQELMRMRMEINAYKTEVYQRIDDLNIGGNIGQITARLSQLENQEQGSTPMGKILQLTLRATALEDRAEQLQEQVHKLKANNIYTPDHVMARLSYVEGAINNMHNTASINQMIEDQINESQQKVEDMLEEKFEEFDVEHKIEKLLEEAIDDGTISITFTR